MDKINLTGITVRACHGVHDYEKSEAHPFVFDVELGVDLAAAGRSDDLRDTVSYSDVFRTVVKTAREECCNLIERLAGLLCERILALDTRIMLVSVTVHKPEAPLPGEFSDVSVTLSQRRKDG